MISLTPPTALESSVSRKGPPALFSLHPLCRLPSPSRPCPASTSCQICPVWFLPVFQIRNTSPRYTPTWNFQNFRQTCTAPEIPLEILSAGIPELSPRVSHTDSSTHRPRRSARETRSSHRTAVVVVLVRHGQQAKENWCRGRAEKKVRSVPRSRTVRVHHRALGCAVGHGAAMLKSPVTNANTFFSRTPWSPRCSGELLRRRRAASRGSVRTQPDF